METPLELLLTSYRKKLDIKPENAPIFSQIAELYYTQGNLEEAQSACQQALQLQPNLSTAALILERVQQSLANLKSWTPHLALKNWIELDFEFLSNYPDGINKMLENQISGMLIKQVFSKAEIEKVVHKLNKEKKEWVSHQLSSVLGLPVMQPGIDSSQYFRESELWRAELSYLFVEFEVRIEAVLGKMSVDKKVELLRENIDKIYIPANFRTFPPNKAGHRPHTENELFEKNFAASGTHLKQIAKLINSLSYFVVISKPEQGGELIVYDLLWEQTPLYLKAQITSSQRQATLEQFGKKILSPDIGDMILFNGGRIWHTISDLYGKRSRITIGGFVSLSQDEQKIFYWC